MNIQNDRKKFWKKKKKLTIKKFSCIDFILVMDKIHFPKGKYKKKKKKLILKDFFLNKVHWKILKKKNDE